MAYSGLEYKTITEYLPKYSNVYTNYYLVKISCTIWYYVPNIGWNIQSIIYIKYSCFISNYLSIYIMKYLMQYFLKYYIKI